MPQLLWISMAAALLVLPLVLAFFAAPRGQTSFASALLRVPVAFAVDLYLVIAISSVMPVAYAALVTRVLYVVGFGVWRLGSSSRVAVPRHAFWVSALLFAIALAATNRLSWGFNYLGDRQWHIPLVSSIEGQTLPFANVYNGGRLRYHWGGDVATAMARACSLDHLSSAAALALAHDVYMAAGVVWVAAFARAMGVRTWLFPAFCAFALAHHGLIPYRIGEIAKDEPFYSFATVSYRPHVPVSFVASVGLLGALFARVSAPHVRGARRAIVAGLAVTSICDEASVGIFGLVLGATWLFAPRAFARTRTRAFGALLLFGVVTVLPNVWLTGTVGHGGAVRAVAWVWPRFAGTEGIHTPLFSTDGAAMLVRYLGAPVFGFAVLVASRLRGRRARTQGPPWAVIGVVAACLLVSGTFALCLVVNGSAGEAQRYYVAAFLTPMIAAALFADSLRPTLRPVLVFFFGVPVVASLYEDAALLARLRYTEHTPGSHNPNMAFDPFDVDCADVASARFGESPQQVYVDRTGYLLYASCRSLTLPGTNNAGWQMPIYGDSSVERQRSALERSVVVDDAHAACWRNRASDPVCTELKSGGKCKPGDRYFLDCELPLPPNRIQRLPKTSSSASAM